MKKICTFYGQNEIMWLKCFIFVFFFVFTATQCIEIWFVRRCTLDWYLWLQPLLFLCILSKVTIYWPSQMVLQRIYCSRPCLSHIGLSSCSRHCKMCQAYNAASHQFLWWMEVIHTYIKWSKNVTQLICCCVSYVSECI